MNTLNKNLDGLTPRELGGCSARARAPTDGTHTTRTREGVQHEHEPPPTARTPRELGRVFSKSKLGRPWVTGPHRRQWGPEYSIVGRYEQWWRHWGPEYSSAGPHMRRWRHWGPAYSSVGLHVQWWPWGPEYSIVGPHMQQWRHWGPEYSSMRPYVQRLSYADGFILRRKTQE